MRHRRIFQLAALLLSLSPCFAAAKDLCVQLDDNGDVFVLRKIKVKPGASGLVGGHLARFRTSTLDFTYAPLTAGFVVADDKIAIGVTTFGVAITDTSTSSSPSAQLHNVICNFGADGRLGPPDSCTFDATISLPNAATSQRPLHVVDCIDALSP
jgi:hypothetical protein